MGIKTFGSCVSKPLVHVYQNLWFMGYQKNILSKKRRYKNGCLNKNKNSFDDGLQYKNKKSMGL
jgi:hypothetical protein